MTPELRELLELSAKAMGYEHGSVYEFGCLLCFDGVKNVWWEPHQSSHQCFDMECRLDITSGRVPGAEGKWLASHDFDNCAIESLSDHNNNRAKARMVASLRVAAEIGKRLADNPVSLNQQEK